MSVPQISFAVREWIRERLLDDIDGFNANIVVASAFYGVPSFQLSATNLFLGRLDVASIRLAGSVSDPPLVILSVAKSDSTGKLALKVTPSVFSGAVIVSIDFYTGFGCSQVPPDGEANFFAQESALTQSLNGYGTYASKPGEVGYNNEILSEQGLLIWGSAGWTQLNSFALIANNIVSQ